MTRCGPSSGMVDIEATYCDVAANIRVGYLQKTNNLQAKAEDATGSSRTSKPQWSANQLFSNHKTQTERSIRHNWTKAMPKSASETMELVKEVE